MQNKKERFIEAWKTIFNVEEVKDDDNFFEAGGDSLKGVQLLGCLAEKGLKLDMLKIYTQPTVEELVEELEEMDPVEIPSDVFTGQVSGEALEKYLQDPSVRKAMADFGIREEDVREKLQSSSGMNGTEFANANGSQGSADATCVNTNADGAGGNASVDGADAASQAQFAQTGAMPPFGMPLNFGNLPGGAVWGIPVQPGEMAPQQGYMIPLQLMLYAVPVPVQDGNVQPPFPGAVPISLVAYPQGFNVADDPNDSKADS